jgi:hypothetical protein
LTQTTNIPYFNIGSLKGCVKDKNSIELIMNLTEIKWSLCTDIMEFMHEFKNISVCRRLLLLDIFGII